MVYRGLVRGGVVVIDGDTVLPEGTAVTIEASKVAEAPPGAPPGRSAADDAEKVDRLLGGLGQTSAEQMRAQQRLDRFL